MGLDFGVHEMDSAAVCPCWYLIDGVLRLFVDFGFRYHIKRHGIFDWSANYRDFVALMCRKPRPPTSTPKTRLKRVDALSGIRPKVGLAGKCSGTTCIPRLRPRAGADRPQLAPTEPRLAGRMTSPRRAQGGELGFMIDTSFFHFLSSPFIQFCHGEPNPSYADPPARLAAAAALL